MCLILLAWQVHPAFPLVVAANRDEFFARPAAAAGPWPGEPGLWGGRDLEAGGTWLAVRDDGRFAAVTNVREPGAPQGTRSRGTLPRDFLVGAQTPEGYAHALAGQDLSGYNLLLSDREALWWCSNRADAPRRLAPGVYGLSNRQLDTPWPKVVKAKARFTEALKALPDLAPCFDLLADPSPAPDAALPDTGVPLAWERILSSVFIQSPTYGTRASTVLTRDRDGRFQVEERRFGAEGPLGRSMGSA